MSKGKRKELIKELASKSQKSKTPVLDALKERIAKQKSQGIELFNSDTIE
jgi:hypothetical protein